MLVRQPPHLDGVVVRRDAHERVRFDETMVAAEDIDYLLRLAQEGPVVALDSVLAEISRDWRGSAISRRTRVEGRLQLHDKHAPLFRDPQAEAFHQLRLGHQYRSAGQRVRASLAFVRASRHPEIRISAVKGIAAAVPGRWL